MSCGPQPGPLCRQAKASSSLDQAARSKVTETGRDLWNPATWFFQVGQVTVLQRPLLTSHKQQVSWSQVRGQR